MTFEDCFSKQRAIEHEFASCSTTEQKYEKIIKLGRSLGKISIEYKTPDALVRGCQSVMYLRTYSKDGKIFFEAESDALISAGLAMILLRVYSGESAETIIKCPADYLENLDIPGSLTPGRAIGLASLHRTMQQHALKALMNA